MEDKALHTIKAQKNKNPRKFYTHFIFKAVIVTIILVVIPIFPSEAPDFITPSSISTTIWELFCPIVVGVVVTYGLFSSKNDNDHDHIKTENGSTFDHAQSYIAKYLHVPSIYDDDEEEDNNSSMSHGDDSVNTNSNNDNNNKKVQTWNSKYHRNQPSIVVVDDDDKTRRVLEKPLLLPVRSLKSRVCDVDNDAELMKRSDSRMYNWPSFTHGTSTNEGKYVGSEENKVSKVYNRSNSSPSSRGFSNEMKRMSRNGSGKSRLAVGNEFGYCDEGGGSGGGGGGGCGLSRSLSGNSRKYGMLVDDEKNNEVKQNEETVVLPSPIPWRSRAGRMENNGNSDEFGSFSLKPSSLEEMGPSRSIRSRSSRSSRSSSSSSGSPSMLSSPVASPKKVSPSPSVEFETLAKSNEDSGRKMVYSSRLPPPPPPPPPPPMYGSRLMKVSSAIEHEQGSSHQKEFKPSVWSEPRSIGGESAESMGKSVRTVGADQITREINGEDNSDETEDESFSEFPKETTNFLEQVLAETDDESESDDEIYNEATSNLEKEGESNNFIDESPDVDKKADEFIAKFREQIRLQRIESIKRSTGQLKRNGTR